MRTTRRRALAALLSVSLLAAAPAAAQTAPTAPPGAAGQARPTSVSDDVFRKTRPATFQLEQRSATDKNEPDGLGTGFFISADGLALTAYHVIFGAKALSAVTLDGERLPVIVVGFDDYNDIALVQVQAKRKVPFIPLATVAPKVGDAALAIGNSQGVFLKEKRGTLQRLGVEADLADFPSNTLELDAQLRPGDSGGPIINARGEAIGVVSYIRLVGQERNRLRFASHAIPVTSDSSLLGALRRGEKRDAPVMGIGRQVVPGTGLNVPVSIMLDEYNDFEGLGLGAKPGVTFETVAEGGPAQKAGLRPLAPEARQQLSGDVILAIDGRGIRRWNDLVAEVRSKRIGDTIRLTVQRGPQQLDVNLTLTSRAELYGSGK